MRLKMWPLVLILVYLFSSTQGCKPVSNPLCKDKVINIQDECHAVSLELPKYNNDLPGLIQTQKSSEIIATGVWLGYYTPGSWFTLYGDVVRWGNWKLTMKDHGANHVCVHFENDEYKKWETTECKDSFPFCEKTRPNRNCSNWNHELQSDVTAVTCIQLGDHSRVYWVGQDKSKFSEATAFCEELNGTLAFFSDRDLWEKVTQSDWFGDSENKKHGPLYLGMRKEQVIWGTQASDSAEWTNWKADEPKISTDQNCVVMNKDKTYQWETVDCTTSDRRGLCYGDCPSNNDKIVKDDVNQCYFVTFGTGNMETLRKFCFQNGASLATVPNRSTMDNITQILPNDKHILLSITNRFWYTFDGRRVEKLKWRPDEPNNLNSNEHCAILQVNNRNLTDYIMFDTACSYDTGAKALCQSKTGELWESSEKFQHVIDAHRDCRSNNSVLAVPYHDLISSDSLIPSFWAYWVGVTDHPRFWYNTEGEVIDVVGMGTEAENCMMGQNNTKANLGYQMTAASCENADIHGLCVNTTFSGELIGIFQFDRTAEEPTTSLEQTTTGLTVDRVETKTRSTEFSSDPPTATAESTKSATESTTTSEELTRTTAKSTTVSARSTTTGVGPTKTKTESKTTTTTLESTSTANFTTASARHTVIAAEATTTIAESSTNSEKLTTTAKSTPVSARRTSVAAESTTSIAESSTTTEKSATAYRESTSVSADAKPTTAEPAQTRSEPTITSIETSKSTTSLPTYSLETTKSPTTATTFNTIKPSAQNIFKRLCICQCQVDSEKRRALQERVDAVKRELALQKRDLSSTIRSRISAPDDRPSSQFIGTSATILLISIFGVILATDLVTFGRTIGQMN